MNISKIIEKYIPAAEKSAPSVGKIILKTALITTAALAFIPTVFKKTANGFEAYGILSHMKYEKNPKQNATYEMNFTYNMIDLDRYSADEPVAEEIEEIEALEFVEESDNIEA
jgi:hypothetical protein